MLRTHWFLCGFLVLVVSGCGVEGKCKDKITRDYGRREDNPEMFDTMVRECKNNPSIYNIE